MPLQPLPLSPHGQRGLTSDEWSVILPVVAQTVHEDSRLTLFDADGRRMDRAAGYGYRWQRRDSVPGCRRP